MKGERGGERVGSQTEGKHAPNAKRAESGELGIHVSGDSHIRQERGGKGEHSCRKERRRETITLPLV